MRNLNTEDYDAFRTRTHFGLDAITVSVRMLFFPHSFQANFQGFTLTKE